MRFGESTPRPALVSAEAFQFNLPCGTVTGNFNGRRQRIAAQHGAFTVFDLTVHITGTYDAVLFRFIYAVRHAQQHFAQILHRDGNSGKFAQQGFSKAGFIGLAGDIGRERTF